MALEIKLVLLGSAEVGKSSLVIRYISDAYSELYEATVEESYRKTALIEDRPVLLDILDAGGQAEMQSLIDSNISSGEGFLVCFSLNSRKSFEEAGVLVERIQRLKDTERAPMVGTKCDLDARAVTAEECERLAARANCPFYETSALTKINVEEIFIQAGEQVCRKVAVQRVGTKMMAFQSGRCTVT